MKKVTLNEQVSRIKGMMGLNEWGIKRQGILFNNLGKVSVQASEDHYCYPQDNDGPYSEVEMAFPSEECELPEELLDYMENPGGNPNKSVYANVPVSILLKMVEMNGGIRYGELPPLVDENNDLSTSSNTPENTNKGEDESDIMLSIVKHIFDNKLPKSEAEEIIKNSPISQERKNYLHDIEKRRSDY
jgi:hypothetical protein